MMNWNKNLIAVVICGYWLISAAELDAGFVVRISDGITTETIGDNSVGDLDFSTDGVVMVSHSFGWGSLSFEASITNPAQDGTTSGGPLMSLSSLQLSSNVPGDRKLLIEVTSTEYDGVPGNQLGTLQSSIDGAGSGVLSFSTFADRNNQEFGQDQQLGDQFQFVNAGNPNFSSSWMSNWMGDGQPLAPFSLTMRALIGQGSDVTSFDAELAAVPEPASWIVWLGIVPIVAIWLTWRRKTQVVGAV